MMPIRPPGWEHGGAGRGRSAFRGRGGGRLLGKRVEAVGLAGRRAVRPQSPRAAQEPGAPEPRVDDPRAAPYLREGEGNSYPLSLSRAHFWVGMAQEQFSRPDDAIRELEMTISYGGPASIYLAALGHAYTVAGQRDKALAVLDDLQTRAKSRCISPLDIATVYLGLGETDATFAWLERAYETRASARPLSRRRSPL